MIKSNDFGVLYVATGSRYIKETIRSASSVNAVMPEIPIAIWVDDDSLIPSDLFGSVSMIKNPTCSFFDKIVPMTHSPFEKTLYLDTDTLIIEPVTELPLLLDRFDLAYCHSTIRITPGYEIAKCPEAFSEPNTGVILYRNIEPVKNLFLNWAEIYKRQLSQEVQPRHDQLAFREAVYTSSLNFTILPPEYNFRTIFPGFAGENVKVKILHGRGKSLIKAKKRINRYLDVRIADYLSFSWKNAFDILKGLIRRLTRPIVRRHYIR